MRSRFLSALGIVAVMVAGVGTSVPALAASKPASVKPAPVSFSLSPARAEISGGHGAHYETFTVHNGGTARLTLRATVLQGHERVNGSSYFTAPGPQSGAAWIRTPGLIVLKPGQVQRFRVAVTVPKIHDPGQRYLGLQVASVSPKGKHQTSAAVSAAITAEMVIDVPGKVIRRVQMGISAPGFSAGGPVKVTATIRNTGNAYYLNNKLRAQAGNQVVAFPGVLALAGSVRTVSATWSHPALCLPCRVHLAGSSAAVWSVPLVPIGGGAAVLLLLVVVVWLSNRAGRRAVRKNAYRMD